MLSWRPVGLGQGCLAIGTKLKLFCQQCGAAIPAEDVDLSTLHARCRKCDEVFSFDRSLREGAGRTRAEVPQPERIRVVEDGGGFRAERTWYSPIIFLYLGFAVFWDAFLFVWFSKAFSVGAFVLFALPHAVVGIGLTYFVLVSFFNRTIVEIRGNRLRCFHEPFPWPGSANLDVRDIRQLYVQEKMSYGQHGHSHRRFRLYALTQVGEKVLLIRGLREMDEALFFEQQVERFLGIPDEAVGGELPR